VNYANLKCRLVTSTHLLTIGFADVIVVSRYIRISVRNAKSHLQKEN